MEVKLHAFDEYLGGRDFDELVFTHFCEEIKAQHKLDIRSNKKASFKLRTACEKENTGKPFGLGFCLVSGSKYYSGISCKKNCSKQLVLSKMKKMLSANAEAPYNIECIMEDIDVKGMIKREQLEELSKPIIEKFKALLQQVRPSHMTAAYWVLSVTCESVLRAAQGRTHCMPLWHAHH
eukprot:1139260-Pelagomonas_calceolata.AAC.4